jgi:hypothetical protein
MHYSLLATQDYRISKANLKLKILLKGTKPIVIAYRNISL